MRTPDEIKKGLECCQSLAGCRKCPYFNECAVCSVFPGRTLHVDAIIYIQQLERERDEARNDLDTLNYATTELHSAYEAMKRERDAAVGSLKRYAACLDCTHYRQEAFGYQQPICQGCKFGSNWQWRGVQEVE